MSKLPMLRYENNWSYMRDYSAINQAFWVDFDINMTQQIASKN